MLNKKKKIIVIGAGPAGMMAAIRAGELGQDVVLVEKNNSLGTKLLITGNTRCNLTNTYDLETFISKLPGNGNFLRGAFKKMFNDDLLEFFKKRDVSFVVEKGHKVFPSLGNAKTILDVLERELKKNKVKVCCFAKMSGIVVVDRRVKALKCANGAEIDCDSIIIATGGITYPSTGSTGDGIRVAKKLGHKITKPMPALVPLEVVEKYPRQLEGLTCQDIKLKVICDGKKPLSTTGDLIFTSSGISGPAVLYLSGTIASWLESKKKVYSQIDMMPGLTEKEVEALLIKTFNDNSGKSIRNTLSSLLPGRLTDLFIRIADIDPDKKTGNITQKERRNILMQIKKVTFQINKIKGLSHAVITRGGVSLKEIDPETMESCKIKDLYFAGEVIDIDGDTGGFNLQIAFSTGYLAGESASKGSVTRVK